MKSDNPYPNMNMDFDALVPKGMGEIHPKNSLALRKAFITRDAMKEQNLREIFPYKPQPSNEVDT